MPADRPRRWPLRPAAHAARVVLPDPAVAALEALEAKIKPDFKLAVGAGLAALACLVVGVDLGGVHRHGPLRWVNSGLTVGFVVLGAACVRSTGRELNRIAKVRADVDPAQV